MSSSARFIRTIAGIALGAAAPVAVVAWADFTRPIGDAGTHGIKESCAVVALVAPAVALAGYLFATRDSLHRLRTVAAWLFAIAAAFVFFAAARRSGDFDRGRLVTDMPIAGTLRAGGPPLAVGSVSVTLGDQGSCYVTTSVRDGFDETDWLRDSVKGCAPVRVRHDARNAIVVIEHIPLWAAPSSGAWQTVAVRSTRDGREVSLQDIHAFKGSLVVPPTWAMIAACSAALSLLMALVAKMYRRRAAALGSLTDATHEGRGWFALRDGRRFRVAAAADLILGAFAVRVEEPAVAGSYRASSSARVEPVAPGTKREWIDDPRAFAVAYDAVAIAAAAIGMMPALMALLVLMA
jgi:hypothetical protein